MAEPLERSERSENDGALAAAPGGQAHLGTAEQVFDLFESANRKDHPSVGRRHKGGLSKRSAKVYRSFWLSYARWLAGKKLAWYEARPEDVDGFIASVEPRSKRHKNSSDTPVRELSDVTRQRYQRVFERIYQFALSSQLHPGLVGSPAIVREIDGWTRREDMESLVLQPAYRQCVIDGIETQKEGLDARDQAMVALMTLEGLTAREVATLQCKDLEWEQGHTPGLGWWKRLHRWREAPRPLAILVRATGAKLRIWQERRLVLSDVSSSAIRSWLEWRGPYVPYGSDGATADAEQEDTPSPSGVLLCGPKGALSNQVVYSIAKTHMLKALAPDKVSGNPGLLKDLGHMGPMVLRNIAIMNWIDAGHESGEVVGLAGLSSAKSLRRFVHHAMGKTKQQLDEAVRASDGRLVAIGLTNKHDVDAKE